MAGALCPGERRRHSPAACILPGPEVTGKFTLFLLQQWLPTALSKPNQLRLDTAGGANSILLSLSLSRGASLGFDTVLTP